MSKKNLYLTAALTGLLVVGGAWQGTMRPALAEKELVTSRDARVDGKTVGEVLLKGKVALRFLSGAGSLSTIERADLVAGRLNRLDEDKSLKASELRVKSAGGLAILTARGMDIVTVTAEDGKTLGLSAQDTADLWVQNLSDALAGREVSEAALRGKPSARLAAAREDDRDRDDRGKDRAGDRDVKSAADDDFYPDLKKKIVPIISAGSSLNIGVAQVQGEERDVDRCKAVAQLETDWKDKARIKILVPISAESVKHIDRVPGVAVSAIADYKIQD